MDIEWLNGLRLYEWNTVMNMIGVDKNLSVLEIGAGTGIQAKQFAESGFTVKAIDVGCSNYIDNQVFPVEVYDGVHIPYEDDSFDVIFSSNVLEHIPHIEDFLKTELKRVLKHDGMSIHVVPSASWRLWSNVTHYMDMPARLLRFVHKQHVNQDTGRNDAVVQRTIVKKILSYIIPLRHGERGNMATELYHFSRFGWNSLFDRTGWIINRRISSGIFYTGSEIGGTYLSIPVRCILSRFLGSSTHIYVVKKCVE